MINLEHVVLIDPMQMNFIIEGMRNPMNSWDKSDTEWFDIGPNDLDLMRRLSKAGIDHRKFMRMMVVYVRITAPLYWWKEFDTYKVGVVPNSCSTMHKIQEKEFVLGDFSWEHLKAPSIKMLRDTIDILNEWRAHYNECDSNCRKDYWWQMIQLLPSSYNQTRNIMLNYEVLANIYKSRRDHKLDEWVRFCVWIEGLPHYELITGDDVDD